MRVFSVALAPALVLDLCVAAQVPPSGGPLVAAPLAFGVDEATALGSPATRGAQPYWKPEGYRVALPPILPTAMVDYSAAAVFGPHATAPYPDIDAMSVGLDIIPATSGGVVAVPPGHWNFAFFSVRRGSTGAPGSVIRAEAGTPGGNEADVFSYVFRDTVCLPAEFTGRTAKLADATDYGLPLPGEVDALDLAMNLWAHEAVLAPTLGMPACPTACPMFFFSLEGSPANLARMAPAAWGGETPSGAVVFACTWNGASWSAPAVAFTAAQLGLTTCEDLDALAVDLFGLGGTQILFSTKAGGCVTQPDELMFLRCPCVTAAAPVPLRYADGTRVSRELGIDPGDDVDAICVGDPICAGVRSGRMGELQFERTVAQPWANSVTFGFPRQLAIQALRVPMPPTNGFAYQLVTVGALQGSLGALLVTIPALYPAQFPLQLGFQVPLTSPFAGNPVPLPLQLPPSMAGAELVLQAATLPRTPPLTLRVSHALRLVVE